MASPLLSTRVLERLPDPQRFHLKTVKINQVPPKNPSGSEPVTASRVLQDICKLSLPISFLFLRPPPVSLQAEQEECI
jgi:hypothetical protein